MNVSLWMLAVLVGFIFYSQQSVATAHALLRRPQASRWTHWIR